MHADHGYYWSNFILHKLSGLDTQIVLLWRQQFIKLVVVRHWKPDKHVTVDSSMYESFDARITGTRFPRIITGDTRPGYGKDLNKHRK